VRVSEGKRRRKVIRPQIPRGLYFSPCFQLKRFVDLLEKHGVAALTARQFQAEREAWIGAMFLLGYSQLTKQDWWLIQAEDDPPDIIALALEEGSRGPVAERLNIEIFEYEQNSPMNDLVGTIQRKLAGKAYPADYQLVCYVHHHEGEPFNPGEAAEQVQALNPRIRDIWVVASIMSQNPAEYVLVRLFPQPLVHRFDYRQACSGTKQPDIVEPKRGPANAPVEFGWRKVDLP
jgi:hypothetical protein